MATQFCLSNATVLFRTIWRCRPQGNDSSATGTSTSALRTVGLQLLPTRSKLAERLHEEERLQSQDHFVAELLHPASSHRNLRSLLLLKHTDLSQHPQRQSAEQLAIDLRLVSDLASN